MQKQIISVEEFNKKVEIEAAHLEYMDRLKWQEAIKIARQTVSEKYTTQ